MTTFKKMLSKCMECGKEIEVNSFYEKGFCDKVCRTNYAYRKRFKGGWNEDVPSADKVKKF